MWVKKILSVLIDYCLYSLKLLYIIHRLRYRYQYLINTVCTVLFTAAAYCREVLSAAQRELGSVRSAARGDQEQLAALQLEGAALRREVAQLLAAKTQIEAALAQVDDLSSPLSYPHSDLVLS